MIGNKYSINRKNHILVPLAATLTVLLLQYYLSASGSAGNYIASLPILSNLSYEFSYVIGWGAFTAAIYLVIPIIAIYTLKESFSYYGLSLNKGGGYIYIYSPLIILPITFIASQNSDFQNTYPFLYNPSSIQQLVIWELIYIFQFLALEFFFRGFILQSILKFTNTVPAILLASIPYMIIHFVKPTPEAIASFFGGAILCWLAVRYKSIAIGFYLHVILAVSMDIFALYHRGWFNVS